LQGNYHCLELMHRSFSQSLVQPENLFYTPGYILVCCCALVQWEIPWIIILVSLTSWFQCYCAQSESLCSWQRRSKRVLERFQHDLSPAQVFATYGPSLIELTHGPAARLLGMAPGEAESLDD
jgi:hypothetical protein